MLRLGQKKTVVDLALGMEGEQGQYRVIFPSGDAYLLTCEPGHSITSLVPTKHRAVKGTTNPEPGTFWVEKIADID